MKGTNFNFYYRKQIKPLAKIAIDKFFEVNLYLKKVKNYLNDCSHLFLGNKFQETFIRHQSTVPES